MNRNEQKCSNCTRGDWGRELGLENTHQYFVKFLVHTCHAPSLINGVNIDKNTAIVRLPAPQTHNTLHAAWSCVESSPYIVSCIAWLRALVRLYWDCGKGKTTVVIRICSLHTSGTGQRRGLLWMFRDQFQLMLLPLHHSKWSVGSQSGKYTLYTAKMSKVWTYLQLVYSSFKNEVSSCMQEGVRIQMR